MIQSLLHISYITHITLFSRHFQTFSVAPSKVFVTKETHEKFLNTLCVTHPSVKEPTYSIVGKHWFAGHFAHLLNQKMQKIQNYKKIQSL